MRPLKPIIEFHGPMADHNMPCALCNTGSAVLELNTGIFQPCWSCQERGYRVKKRPWWIIRRWWR
jgi:hypothetical protein